MYQKLEFTQEVSIQHPIAAYKLHIVYLAIDLTLYQYHQIAAKT